MTRLPGFIHNIPVQEGFVNLRPRWNLVYFDLPCPTIAQSDPRSGVPAIDGVDDRASQSLRAHTGFIFRHRRSTHQHPLRVSGG